MDLKNYPKIVLIMTLFLVLGLLPVMTPTASAAYPDPYSVEVNTTLPMTFADLSGISELNDVDYMYIEGYTRPTDGTHDAKLSFSDSFASEMDYLPDEFTEPKTDIVFDPGEFIYFLADQPGTYTFHIAVWLTDNSTSETSCAVSRTITVVVASANEVPTVTNFAKAGEEDTEISFTAGDFTAGFHDNDGDLLSKIEITALPLHGTLYLNNEEAGLNSEITTDNIADLKYVPASNWYGNDSFQWRGFDGTDFSAEATVDISVSSLNDAPTITAPSSLAFNEDQIGFINGISMADVDAGSAEVNVTYSVTAGTLTGGTGGGVIATGSGTTTLNLRGLIADLNSYIFGENLMFTSPLNDTSNVTLSVVVEDNGNTGAGGSKSTSKTVTLTVNPVNDAPTLTEIASLTGAVAHTAFPITYADLAAAADEADIDCDELSFRIEQVLSGTLKKEPAAVTPGSTTLASGESLSWTPDEYGTGVEAFTVKAFDGLLASASPVTVKVDVTQAKATEPTASVVSGSTVKKNTSITLSAEDSSSIYYTVAAGVIPADPTGDSSHLPSGNTITIDGDYGQTITVKTYAAVSGKEDSSIAIFIYTIQPQQVLTVTGLTANDKEYDGNVTATLSGVAVLSGTRNDGDDVSLIGVPSAAFTDKDAAVNIPVTVDGFSLAGADAEYYTLAQPEGLTASITRKTITLATISIAEKTYDGTNNAVITAAHLDGVIGSDDVSVDTSGAAATFSDANIGGEKDVTVSGTFILSGADAGNYLLAETLPSYIVGSILPAGTVLAPTSDVTGGAVPAGTTVTLSCDTTGATIYYTTDGSTPTSGSMVYTAPITVNPPMTVKAMAIKLNMHDSGIMSETYTLRAPSHGNGNSGGANGSLGLGAGAPIMVNDKTESAGSASTATVNGQTVTTITVNADKLDKLLETEGKNAKVVIPVSGGSDVAVGVLTGLTVKNMEAKGAVLDIKTDAVTYTLPASQINIGVISAEMGEQIELKDINVNVRIAEPTPDTVKIIEDIAKKNTYQIVIKPVDFQITCTNGSKTVEVSDFNAYVERTIAIPAGVDSSKITTGVVLNADGTCSHVPTTITMIDGKYYAKINSLTNSTYSVIYNPVEFSDVDNHWAKNAINDLGSRLVVSGTGDDHRYEPEREITRAEFATIVVRALGLMRPAEERTAAVFSDVSQEAWYVNGVSIAYQNGIISGYGNGQFGPNDRITREQAMSMIARAMKITGLPVVSGEEAETTKLLGRFGDLAQSASWAQKSIATCVKAGVVAGKSENMLAPKDEITRAEAAVIVQRLLQKSGLI